MDHGTGQHFRLALYYFYEDIVQSRWLGPPFVWFSADMSCSLAEFNEYNHLLMTLWAVQDIFQKDQEYGLGSILLTINQGTSFEVVGL